jgi:hypothetical protein
MSWSWMRRRLTFANVVAVIALFLALGSGVALAGRGGARGTIVGYAQVKADGTVVANRSLNVAQSNVALESTAAYCFRNLPFSFKGAQVTVDYRIANTLSGETEQAEFTRGNPFGDCAGSGVQAEVATSDGLNFEPVSFFIVFYK